MFRGIDGGRSGRLGAAGKHENGKTGMQELHFNPPQVQAADADRAAQVTAIMRSAKKP